MPRTLPQTKAKRTLSAPHAAFGTLWLPSARSRPFRRASPCPPRRSPWWFTCRAAWNSWLRCALALDCIRRTHGAGKHGAKTRNPTNVLTPSFSGDSSLHRFFSSKPSPVLFWEPFAPGYPGWVPRSPPTCLKIHQPSETKLTCCHVQPLNAFWPASYQQDAHE